MSKENAMSKSAKTEKARWSPPYCADDTDLTCPKCGAEASVCVREQETRFDADTCEGYCNECHVALDVDVTAQGASRRNDDMTTKLHLGDGLELPLDAVTQKLSFLGRTGSGKSYAASKLVEQMLSHRAQVVVLDPVGVHYGLRIGADSKRGGFDIPVFGGLHGDVPLEPTAGALVADVIVDSSSSAVLDVSQMLSSEQARFATAFASRFFDRKKAKPSAVHVLIEECQEFVPQNVTGAEAHMVHAFERMIKLGRNFGIGVSLVSQRPQEVNKKALNQTECLFAFQMTGPQERKTMKQWVAEKGLAENIDELLPKLRVGEPHVWSPQWLRISKTVRILPKQTLDASSTPKVGGHAAAVRELTPIDLDALRKRMASTLEKAKADDPKALRARIAELEKAAKAPAAAPAPPKVERVEVPVLTSEESAKLAEVTEELLFAKNAFDKTHAVASDLLAAIRARASAAPVHAKTNGASTHTRFVAGPVGTRHVVTARFSGKDVRVDVDPPGVRLGSGERAILTAVAQHADSVTREQLTVLTGYKRSSRDTYLQRLRAAGLVDQHGENLVATSAGVALLGDGFDPLPTGDALRSHWLGRLPEGERRIFELVCKAYPSTVDRDRLSDATGYKRSSRDTYLQRLSARKLVESQGRGEVRASETLFS